MGKVVKFRRPPKNRGQFRGWKPAGWIKHRAGQPMGLPQILLIVLGLSLGGMAAAIGWGWATRPPDPEAFTCSSVSILDGDTFRCDGERIRLEGIDAPELPGHCREGRDCAPGDPHASADNLARLVEWHTVTCRKTDTDVYGRTVARCTAGKVDLSCAQIDGGHAIRRYGMILCD